MRKRRCKHWARQRCGQDGSRRAWSTSGCVRALAGGIALELSLQGSPKILTGLNILQTSRAFDPLREDAGLAEMQGQKVPSAEAARKFLYQFYDAAKIEAAQQQLALDRVAYVPGESKPLQALGGGEPGCGSGTGPSLGH